MPDRVNRPEAQSDRPTSALGDAVRHLCESSTPKWSNETLASLLGVSLSTAKNLRRGTCKPNSPTVAKLFALLGFKDIPILQRTVDADSIDLTTGPDYHIVQKRVKDVAYGATPDWTGDAPPLRMFRLFGDRRQWDASGLSREVVHVAVPEDLLEGTTIHAAYANPDDGGNIARGRIVLINCDQIPLGFDPDRCRKGDSVLVAYPDGIDRTRVYLGDSRVFNTTTKEITETDQPGHRIIGKVICHIPAQPNTAMSTYTGDLPD